MFYTSKDASFIGWPISSYTLTLVFLLRFISFYFSRVGTYNRWGKCIRGIARSIASSSTAQNMPQKNERVGRKDLQRTHALCWRPRKRRLWGEKMSVLYLTNKFPIMRELVLESRLQDTEYTLYILSKAKICVGPCILLNMKAQMSICCLQTFQL